MGKVVHGTHMTKDQEIVLEQLIAYMEEEQPDVLLISGDIYDRSIPPTEAVELLDDVLSKIVIAHQTKVIMIAGNHDSPDRLGFASKILQDQGLYIRGNLDHKFAPIVLEDEFGKVNFYPIPYVEPAIARAFFEDKEIRDHDAAMGRIIQEIEIKLNPSERNVCLAHGYIMGGEVLETSDSERRLSIGGSECVSVDYFRKFNYTALGHLHRPQKVKVDHIRYAGSLLKYSFSEARQKKSVTMIEMDGEGLVAINQHEFAPLHDMRIIKGELEKLLDPAIFSAAPVDDYVMAVLTDRGELIDPIGKLRGVYPNVLRIQREAFDREAGEEKTAASHKFLEKNPLDLFGEFYENAAGEDFDEDKRIEMKAIFDELEQKRRNA